MTILQINFKLNVSPSKYRKICEALARTIAGVPGLVWKIWLINEQDGEAVGIYLFQDEQSLAAYLASAIVEQIRGLPQLREINAKCFKTISELTVVARGSHFAATTVGGVADHCREGRAHQKEHHNC